MQHIWPIEAVITYLKKSSIEERIPEKSFKFPQKSYKNSTRKDGTYIRYCNRDWLDEFPFLAYSKSQDGLYCLSCILFPCGIPSQQRANLLISAPYQNWKDARADILKHSTLKYHLQSEYSRRAFVEAQKGAQLRVDHCLTLLNIRN